MKRWVVVAAISCAASCSTDDNVQPGSADTTDTITTVDGRLDSFEQTLRVWAGGSISEVCGTTGWIDLPTMSVGVDLRGAVQRRHRGGGHRTAGDEMEGSGGLRRGSREPATL